MDSASVGERVTAGFRKLGFIQYAGITGVEFAEGRYVVSIAPEARHLNHNGDVHAAVLFGVAETAAMGAAVSGAGELTSAIFIVAKDGRIEYRARAKGEAGPFLGTSEIPEAVLSGLSADIVDRVPVEFEVPVEITDAAGTVVATAAFTAVIRPRRR